MFITLHWELEGKVECSSQLKNFSKGKTKTYVKQTNKQKQGERSGS